MMKRKKSLRQFWISMFLLVGVLSLSACAPVGSEAWCRKMKNKEKGDWTVNEARDYAKHCLLR